MSKWVYVQDIKKEEAEAFCEKSMKEHSNRFYGTATGRSNNPGRIAIYYKEK